MVTNELSMVVISLTPDDAKLFAEFQKRYEVIAHLVGYMDALRLFDLKNMNISMDIDTAGKVSHTAITRHYRG